MPISLHEMGEGYIQSLKYRIERSQQEIQELVQHLQECENTLRFDNGPDQFTECCNPESGKCDNTKTKGGETASTGHVEEYKHGVVDQEAT
jgi:hypothetical protein|tara:strand:+ start:1897 stop:2169 length:273 start_codon:yes stop_codon:yes gene_type:complete